VKAENPDAMVLMLGYGPIEDDLKKLARDMEIDDRIIWTGYVPQHEVVKYINVSDIYVSTSLRDGSSSSLLESMACGLPAVVSDIPGNTEWIGDGVNGVVVRRGDPDSIARGLNKLLKDDGLRAVMAANNVKKVEEKADFSKNFRKLEDMYGKLAASGKN
jgi:glycosyltransferase involved in cell wall biosynthesis